MALPDKNSTNSPEAVRSPTGFEISAIASGRCNLKIWGRFPPNWTGNLSAGLSKNGINIVSGMAKKEKVSWSAEFEVIPPRFATDLKNIDFLTLSLEGNDADPSVRFTIDEFIIGRPEQNEGALYLEIKARDQLGFLGALLNRLAFYALFPERMLIETENGKIFDRFWIKGVGGGRPSDSSIATLRNKLEGHVDG